MIQIDAMGLACPIPVVKTMNAMKALQGSDILEIRVDNETAVENLTRFANSKNCPVSAEALGKHEFKVTITVGAPVAATAPAPQTPPAPVGGKRRVVAAIASETMGSGDDQLGAALMKGFVYALSQQEELPATILLYNGGAKLSCEGSASLEDLREMEEQGVEILTCGTCLNFYGLTDRLAVGQVSNMYSIVEKLTQADLIVRP